ncbi:MAG: hypothetical protein ACRD8O_23730 [Bryobacteraceae bacterium]
METTVAIRKRYRLKFRAEGFNPFNVPMIANPITNQTDSNFGGIRASNAHSTPRNLQFGFRLAF